MSYLSEREKAAAEEFNHESAEVNKALAKLGVHRATVKEYYTKFSQNTKEPLPDLVADTFVYFITKTETSKRVKSVLLTCLFHPNHFRHHEALLSFLKCEVRKVPDTALSSPSPLHECACAISYSVPPKLRFQVISSLLKDKSFGRFARFVFTQNILRLRSKEAIDLLTVLASTEPELFPNKKWIQKLTSKGK